jgi:hypothetical protein
VALPGKATALASSGGLADTGSDPVGPGGIAAILLLGGAMLVLAVRRPRSRA